MHKRYYALVSKKPEKSQDTLENFLIKDNGSNKALISNEDNRQAKKAILKYVQSDDYSAVEKYFPEYTENGEIKEGYTLLDIDLKTGRFHQIRCQLSYEPSSFIDFSSMAMILISLFKTTGFWYKASVKI